jgi:hypothetical protein
MTNCVSSGTKYLNRREELTCSATARLIIYSFFEQVYCHNLSRFDGILLLKYLVIQPNIILKTRIREHQIDQIIIYDKKKLKTPLLYIRDSLKLLPSLKSLAETMRPELSSKGSIPHKESNKLNIRDKQYELIKYLKQDIMILAGVLKQSIRKILLAGIGLV